MRLFLLYLDYHHKGSLICRVEFSRFYTQSKLFHHFHEFNYLPFKNHKQPHFQGPLLLATGPSEVAFGSKMVNG